jgi:hypothetical protein
MGPILAVPSFKSTPDRIRELRRIRASIRGQKNLKALQSARSLVSQSLAELQNAATRGAAEVIFHHAMRTADRRAELAPGDLEEALSKALGELIEFLESNA